MTFDFLTRCGRLGTAALAMVLVTLGAGVMAQTYPSKPIRMIVPFSPAGSTDVLGRVIGQKLAEVMGQSVVVENRAGADGIIGMDTLAKAPADGYTILFCTTSTLSINPSLYAGKLPYDPEHAFAEVAMTASAPNILVVNPKLPVASVKELIALAKTRQGGLNAASGATMHLLNTKLFESKAGGDYVTVPYKGTGPALVDLVSGQVDMMFDQITTSLPFVREGRLRALAVTSAKRYAGLKDVPTVAESGLPDFETTSWWGVIAPAGTPPSVIARLNADINKALTDPAVVAKIESLGGVPEGGTPQRFAELAKKDRAQWAHIVKTFKISPQ
jgi:tripartite-type tricarboxylate transporter receptor subunit TctC